MKPKRFVIGTCVVLSLIIIFACFRQYTTDFSAVMVENDLKCDVNIIVSNKRIDKILKRMTGNVVVKSEHDKALYEYDFRGQLYDESPDFNYIIVDRVYGKSQYEHGFLYFDKKNENVIIITNAREIYAANDKFIRVVKEFSNFSK